MTEQECLAKMVAPGDRRPNKFREGVIQIRVTRLCNLQCFSCTQGSQLSGPSGTMTPDQFEQACLSLKSYWGVVGTFGGNPTMSKHFVSYCEILRKHFPQEQCGIWCNDPIRAEYAQEMRRTFNPRYSNLNVHLDRKAFEMFKRYWPESMPFGLDKDSRHSPPFVAMKDMVRKTCLSCEGNWPSHTATRWHSSDLVSPCETCSGTGTVPDESKIWELISGCDINKYWSALIGLFRGELRAWFCEIAGAQALLHEGEPDYPDTGVVISGNSGRTEDRKGWWELPMGAFRDQVRKHCFDCGIPLRGYGELSQTEDGKEQVSETHAAIYKPKTRGREVEVVTRLEQLGIGKLQKVTEYLQNASK